MSRIGKKLINIPKGVTVTLDENVLTVKGKHGSLEREFKNLVTFAVNDETGVFVTKCDIYGYGG